MRRQKTDLMPAFRSFDSAKAIPACVKAGRKNISRLIERVIAISVE